MITHFFETKSDYTLSMENANKMSDFGSEMFHANVVICPHTPNNL